MEQELFTNFLKGDVLALNQLLQSHRFRVQRLAEKHQADAEEIFQDVSTAMASLRPNLSPAPSFLHWLYLLTLKELRFRQTGYPGFDGLFETPEEDFRPTQSFSQELNKYLEWMTDDKMEHYRMRFEDGLVFEEMAAHLQKRPVIGKPSSWLTWLEDWKEFLGAQPEK